MIQHQIEIFLYRLPTGLKSRLKQVVYKTIGMKLGKKNRFEKGRIRRATQISIGNYNAFTSGYTLWPEDSDCKHVRIVIGHKNYFNKNLTIDACQSVQIGNNNMIGPDVFITDSNHQFNKIDPPNSFPMEKGRVIIGNNCWIGAKAIILKDVTLGDNCVVGAGAVVTKSFSAGSVVAGVPARLLK